MNEANARDEEAQNELNSKYFTGMVALRTLLKLLLVAKSLKNNYAETKHNLVALKLKPKSESFKL